MKNYLLDTCTLIWMLTESDRLSVRVRDIISDPSNVVYVSSVSFFEMAIKTSIGKLKIDGIDMSTLLFFLDNKGLSIIPLDPFESVALTALPIQDGHRDPFDRLLVTQAIERNLTLISCDTALGAYHSEGLSLIW